MNKMRKEELKKTLLELLKSKKIILGKDLINVNTIIGQDTIELQINYLNSKKDFLGYSTLMKRKISIENYKNQIEEIKEQKENIIECLKSIVGENNIII